MDFQPVELPVFSSLHDRECFLFLPGFEQKSIRGVEYQVDWDRLFLHVFLYDKEDQDRVSGIRVTVDLDESNVKPVEEMETLHVVDPRSLSPGMVGEDEFLHLKQKFNRWKKSKQSDS